MASVVPALSQFSNITGSIAELVCSVANASGGVFALNDNATLTVFGRVGGQVHEWYNGGTKVTFFSRPLPQGEPTSVTTLVNGADGQTVHNATIGQAMPQLNTSTSTPVFQSEPTGHSATPTGLSWQASHQGGTALHTGQTWENILRGGIYRPQQSGQGTTYNRVCTDYGTTGPGLVYGGDTGGQPIDLSKLFRDRPYNNAIAISHGKAQNDAFDREQQSLAQDANIWAKTLKNDQRTHRWELPETVTDFLACSLALKESHGADGANLSHFTLDALDANRPALVDTDWKRSDWHRHFANIHSQVTAERVQAQSSAANQSQTSTGFNTDLEAGEASHNGWLNTKPEGARPGWDREAEKWVEGAVKLGLNRHNRPTHDAWVNDLVHFGQEMTEQRRGGLDNDTLSKTMNRFASSAGHGDIVDTKGMQAMRKSIKQSEWPDTLYNEGLHAHLRGLEWVKTTGNDTQNAADSARQTQPASHLPFSACSGRNPSGGQWFQGSYDHAAPPLSQGNCNPGSAAPSDPAASGDSYWRGPGRQSQSQWTSVSGSQGISNEYPVGETTPHVRFTGVPQCSGYGSHDPASSQPGVVRRCFNSVVRSAANGLNRMGGQFGPHPAYTYNGWRG